MPSESSGTGPVHRMGQLLGADVVLPDGTHAGRVNDVRLAGAPDLPKGRQKSPRNGLQDYVIDGFVVGARGEGAFLGYDRREVLGPWLLRALVRAANREAQYVPWPAVRRIDWEQKVVLVDRLEPLKDERAPA